MTGIVAQSGIRAGTAAPVADRPTEPRVLEDRIELLRGEELVLANPIHPRLLYIPENGSQVAAMLGSVGARAASPAHGQKGLRDDAGHRTNDDWSSFVHVLKEHGLTQEDGASGSALDSLAERALADRRQHTLYLRTSDAEACKLDADLAARKIAEISDTLAKGAALEVVFFAEDSSIDLPLIERIVGTAPVRSAHVNASSSTRRQGDNSPTTNLRLSFRVATDLRDVPDGFVAWASANDVTVLAEGNQSALTGIRDLSEAGVRVPVRISVTDVEPSSLVSLCEACTEANQGAGLVFSRTSGAGHVDRRAGGSPRASSASGRLAGEIASAVLEVQRSHLIALPRVHPQNDWLNRIELGQGLPWSCGMPTGQVSVLGPDGEIGHCPVRSAGVNPSSEETATASSVDSLADCSDCQLRYICGGHCRAATPGCLFERACIEDLLFEVARTAAGQNH